MLHGVGEKAPTLSIGKTEHMIAFCDKIGYNMNYTLLVDGE